MPGLAKKLFIEKHHHTPWSLKLSKIATNCWPTIVKLLDKGVISYIDYSLAVTLLKTIDHPTEAHAALICHLSIAAKNGHLCVRSENDLILPDPKKLWSLVDEDDGDLQTVQQLIHSGFNTLPTELFYCEDDVDLTKPLCLWNNHLYLQKYWLYETEFIESISKIEQGESLLHPNTEILESEIDILLDKQKLLPKQAEAIRIGCQKNLTIISGGPGTGKTYTAGHLIRIFLQSLPENEKAKCKIALAAPTGKAAANLQSSLMHTLSDMPINQSIEAKTLHSLLLTNRSQKFISANFILIDESSMIDAKMMAKLFSSIRPGSKLILLGDRYQLPPVEAGSIFTDLLIAESKNSKNSVVELTKCIRADIEEIVSFSKEINEGNAQNVLEILASDSTAITKHALEDQSLLLQSIIQRYDGIAKNFSNYTELLNSFNTFRVLIPFRKGPFGVDAMNTLILNTLIQKSHDSEQFVSPIIITKNDYQLELFNGETGILIKNNPHSNTILKGDLAIFQTHSINNPVRIIPALLIKNFEYAYCMSIHKSQGSEYDDIAVVLPKGSERFDREILYTAVTRAKKKIEIWCDDEILKECLKNTSQRISGINSRR